MTTETQAQAREALANIRDDHCRCHDMYKQRGMVDPSCNHDTAEYVAILSAFIDSHPDTPAATGKLTMHDRERAALESRARDDEGEFPTLFDLLDFSGENKAHTVIRAALTAAGLPALVARVDALTKERDFLVEEYERAVKCGPQGYLHAAGHLYNAITNAKIDATVAESERDALAAEVERLAFELDMVTGHYERMKAYHILHRGKLLYCDDSMREAYSDEKVRADLAEQRIADLQSRAQAAERDAGRWRNLPKTLSFRNAMWSLEHAARTLARYGDILVAKRIDRAIARISRSVASTDPRPHVKQRNTARTTPPAGDTLNG